MTNKLPEQGKTYKQKTTGDLVMPLMFDSKGFSAWILNKESTRVNDKGHAIGEFFYLKNRSDFFKFFEEIPDQEAPILAQQTTEEEPISNMSDYTSKSIRRIFNHQENLEKRITKLEQLIKSYD